MPLYDYICNNCGVFQEMVPASKYDEPCSCPTCGTASPRTLSMPQLSVVSSVARRGHELNERSANGPKRASETGLKPTGPKIRSKARTAADSSKSLAGSRPWMISH